MTRSALSTIRIIAISLLGLIIVGYSLFQAQKLIAGPVIDVYTPIHGATYRSPLIEVSGRARNVAFLSLNDRKIFTDKDGYFKEKLLLSPGYNIIKLNAQDKFKTYRETLIEVILKEY